MKFFSLEMTDMMAGVYEAEADIIKAKMNDDPEAYKKAVKKWQRAIKNADREVVEDSINLLNAI